MAYFSIFRCAVVDKSERATRWGEASRRAGRAGAPRTPPLRHLDLDLEEPMGGICGTNPRRIRQVRLAKDGIDTHLTVGVKIG